MECLFVEYPKCSTCQKAKKWLTEQGVTFTDRDIKTQNPTKEELKEWHERSGGGGGGGVFKNGVGVFVN